MRDDQRRNQDERDAGFEDALDDLFGDTPNEAEPAAEPLASTPHTALEPAASQPAPRVANVPAGDSAPLTQPPPTGRASPGGRSWRRIGCIAVSALLGAFMLCFVILAVIGFIVGDQATPTPTF